MRFRVLVGHWLKIWFFTSDFFVIGWRMDGIMGFNLFIVCWWTMWFNLLVVSWRVIWFDVFIVCWRLNRWFFTFYIWVVGWRMMRSFTFCFFNLQIVAFDLLVNILWFLTWFLWWLSRSWTFDITMLTFIFYGFFRLFFFHVALWIVRRFCFLCLLISWFVIYYKRNIGWNWFLLVFVCKWTNFLAFIC